MGTEPRWVRRVEAHLGTMISVGAHCGSSAAIDDCFSLIAHYEQMLSRHRPKSEVSRLARGELDLDHVSPEVRVVVGHCERLRRLTAGCFDHEPRTSTANLEDPVLDLDGFAKGWIIDQVALRLRVSGIESFFINAGGDVVTGAAPPGRSTWRVGIQHPEDPAAIAAVLELERGAVATSGFYERGEHIRGARTRRLASVTVVAHDLGTADALATAVHAAGETDPEWWHAVGGCELFTVAADGAFRRSSGEKLNQVRA